MTWLVLAAQFRATECDVPGLVGGFGFVEETPSPDILSVPGEERFELSSVSVPEAGPAVFGENHTWKVTF